MHNLRAWTEWCDVEPQPHMHGCIEAEYVDESGRLAYATLRHYWYADERQLWGHSTGDWRAGTLQTHHPKYYRWRFLGPLVQPPEAQGKSITVWSFYDAPGELRCLSNHGGDEDWIALLPRDTDPPSWMAEGSNFGCCSVSEHQLEDGRKVYIGAHA